MQTRCNLGRQLFIMTLCLCSSASLAHANGSAAKLAELQKTRVELEAELEVRKVQSKIAEEKVRTTPAPKKEMLKSNTPAVVPGSDELDPAQLSVFAITGLGTDLDLELKVAEQGTTQASLGGEVAKNLVVSHVSVDRVQVTNTRTGVVSNIRFYANLPPKPAQSAETVQTTPTQNPYQGQPASSMRPQNYQPQSNLQNIPMLPPPGAGFGSR